MPYLYGLSKAPKRSEPNPNLADKDHVTAIMTAAIVRKKIIRSDFLPNTAALNSMYPPINIKANFPVYVAALPMSFAKAAEKRLINRYAKILT